MWRWSDDAGLDFGVAAVMSRHFAGGVVEDPHVDAAVVWRHGGDQWAASPLSKGAKVDPKMDNGACWCGGGCDGCFGWWFVSRVHSAR